MIGSRPLTKDDYFTVPVGPPSAADEPGLALDNGWLMGQSGDRRVTPEEREALYWAMVSHRHLKETGIIRSGQNDADYLPYGCTLDSYAVRFIVRFKSGTIDDAYLSTGFVDEDDALAFFEGRVNWWWFLGNRVLQIGEFPVNDPTRVTMGEEAQSGSAT